MKNKQTDPSRSATMRAMKSTNTKPEIRVRSLLHRNGYRFRLHRKDLPGTPDIVFPGRHKVILVHGCFWHGHACQRGNRVPKNNREYWVGKVDRNIRRDAANLQKLEAQGWRSFVVWECQIKGEALLRQLQSFLED